LHWKQLVPQGWHVLALVSTNPRLHIPESHNPPPAEVHDWQLLPQAGQVPSAALVNPTAQDPVTHSAALEVLLYVHDRQFAGHATQNEFDSVAALFNAKPLAQF